MGAKTAFGEIENYQAAGANQFYMSEDGTVSTNSADGQSFIWKSSDEIITDTETGKSSTFGDFLSSLGSSVSTFTNTVNSLANAYENVTGSKLITTKSDELKSTGRLNDTDMSTLSMIINSAINKLKTYGIYVGIGIAGIIILNMIIKNKKAKAK